MATKGPKRVATSAERPLLNPIRPLRGPQGAQMGLYRNSVNIVNHFPRWLLKRFLLSPEMRYFLYHTRFHTIKYSDRKLNFFFTFYTFRQRLRGGQCLIVHRWWFPYICPCVLQHVPSHWGARRRLEGLRLIEPKMVLKIPRGRTDGSKYVWI